MEIKHLNDKLYTELPIDELDGRLSMEELQDKLELKCWPKGSSCSSNCSGKSNTCTTVHNQCSTLTVTCGRRNRYLAP